MAMFGQKAGLTIVRNVNPMSQTGDGEPAWSHIANAMRRERGRSPSEVEADYGENRETGAIARSLTRIERARKTSRGRAVPF